MSKRGAKAAEGEGDGIDALRRAVPSATSLTLYMCWHGGVGHGYPETVMDAARRLRKRHMAQGASDDYISVTFAPAAPDVEDFLSGAPYWPTSPTPAAWFSPRSADPDTDEARSG